MKALPHSIGSERAALGCVLLDPECAQRLVGRLQADDFYRPEHGKIRDAMDRIVRAGKTVDPVTLREEGIEGALVDLTDEVSSSVRLEEFMDVIKAKALARRTIKTLRALVERGMQDPPIEEFMGDVSQKLTALAGETPCDSEKVSEVAHSCIVQVSEAMDGRTQTGVPTGLDKLDNSLMGLQPSDLIIVAGRSSMGKTAFGLSIVEHAAVACNIPTLVFSLEMSNKQLGMRLVTSLSGVENNKIRRGFVSEEEFGKVLDAEQILFNAPLWLNQRGAIPIGELCAEARAMHTKHGIGLVMVDYIQLVRGEKSQQREREVASVSAALKMLAKDLNIPVVALSQLNRAVEAQEDKRPKLSHLRESGAIEQDADVVMLLYRDEYYNPLTIDQGVCEVDVAKNRNGPTGTCKVKFDAKTSRFRDLGEDD